MPLQELTPEQKALVIAHGGNPDDYKFNPELLPQTQTSKPSIGSSLLAQAKEHGAALGVGGVAGLAAATALAPFTEGLSLGAIPTILGGTVAGVGGSMATQAAQDALLGQEKTQQLQAEAEVGREAHPYITSAADIAAGALAGGGSLSPKTLFRSGIGLKNLVTGAERETPEIIAAAKAAKELTPSQALTSVGTQAALQPAIQTGISLAQGQGIPSVGELAKSSIGGALFSGQGKFGEWMHGKINGEPAPEVGEKTNYEAPDNKIPETITDAGLNTKTEPDKDWDITKLGANKPAITADDIVNKIIENKAQTAQSVQRIFPNLNLGRDEAIQLLNQANSKRGAEPLAEKPEDEMLSLRRNVPPVEEMAPIYQNPVTGEKTSAGHYPFGGDEENPIPLHRPANTEQVWQQVKDKIAQQEAVTGTKVSDEDARRMFEEMHKAVQGQEQPTLTHDIKNPVELQAALKDGISVREAIQHLAALPEHPASPLMRSWLKTADQKGLDVRIKLTNEDRPYYHPRSDTIFLSKNVLHDSRYLVEEMAHALTIKKIPVEIFEASGKDLLDKMHDYIRNGSDNDLKELFNCYIDASHELGMHGTLFHEGGVAGNPDVVEKAFGNKGKNPNIGYAMGDVGEFIAHIFRNTEFQKFLNTVPSGKVTLLKRIMSAIKSILGMDVKTGYMLERALGHAQNLVGKERPETTSNTDKEFYGRKNLDDKEIPQSKFMGKVGRAFASAIDAARKVSPVIADAHQRFLNTAQALQGKWTNKIVAVGKELSKAEDRDLNNKLIKESVIRKSVRDELNPKQQKAYDVWKELKDETYQHQLKIDEPIITAGGVARSAKSDPNYYAGSVKQDVLDVLKTNTDRAAVNRLHKEMTYWNTKVLKLDPAYSEVVWKRLLDKLQGNLSSHDKSSKTDFNASRIEQGEPLPPSFREESFLKNTKRYFGKKAVDAAHYEHVESNHEVLGLLREKRDAWLRDVKQDPNGGLANNTAIKNLIDTTKSEHGNIAERTEKGISALVSALFIASPTIETHKILSNMVKAISFTDNPYQAARVMAHAITGVKSGYTHAVENGVVKLTARSVGDMFDGSLSGADRMSALAQGVRNISTLGELTTKLSAGLNQAAFECIVPSKIARANAGDKTAQAFVKRIDPDYKIGKSYTKEEANVLASRMASYAHGTGDARNLPHWMMNDSEVSGFMKLAHWSVAQTNNFMHDVYTPARNGNYVPLITSIFGATIGGYIIKEVREELAGKKSQIPSLEEIAGSSKGLAGNKSLVAYNAIAAMQYAGFGGLLSQVAKYPFDFVYKNSPQGATFPLDEVATELADTLKNVSSAIANDPNINWVDLAQEVTRHTLQSNIQLARIAINQGINSGLITGYPAEKKQLADKMGELRRFQEVEGLPYNEIEQGSNPFMNIEQKKFKSTQDIQAAAQQVPELIHNIMTTYASNPEVMRQKLQALKQNSYATFPSMEKMPMAFMKYIGYLQRTQGTEEANRQLQDYMKHKMTNEVKASLVP